VGDASARLLREAIALATERAASESAPILVYEARRRHRGGRGREWLEPVFYTRSESEGPPPREDGVPDPEVVGPPFSGPLVVRVVRPPAS
jgi:hypothetical protein